MAVSKRLRYEVLRRDNHACRYCGATAPDVKLNVDHVIPTSLGGPDKPANLVTACADCNAGKTSSMPNAMAVADVEQETFRQAAVRTRPTHDPETGMPTCWTFRDVELALVEAAWHEAWRAIDPEGPPLANYEDFLDQRSELATRGVGAGAMLAAAVMAGSQKSTNLVWGVPSQANADSPVGEGFSLACDVVFAWETAWETAADQRPPSRDTALACEEITAAIRGGHTREALMDAATSAGAHLSFYIPTYLPEIQAVGGEN
jgi:hypothetical protein